MMKAIRERLSEATKIRSAISTLERLEAIEGRLPEITEQVREARAGYLPKDEIVARLVNWIGEMRRDAERPKSSPHDLATRAHDIVSLLSASESPSAAWVNDPKDMLTVLIWLLGPTLESSAPAAVARLDYQVGLGSRERAERVAALERERDEVIAEHERLVDEVNSRSSSIPWKHLAGAAQRRDSERLQQERANRLGLPQNPGAGVKYND